MLAAAVLTEAPSTTKQWHMSGPTCFMPSLHTSAVNSASLTLPSQFLAKRKHEPLGVAASTLISGRVAGVGPSVAHQCHTGVLSVRPEQPQVCIHPLPRILQQLLPETIVTRACISFPILPQALREGLPSWCPAQQVLIACISHCPLCPDKA